MHPTHPARAPTAPPMKHLRLLLLGLLAVLAVGLHAAWTPETLPMVHLADARRYVCNPDGLLSAAAVDSTDALLARLERTKGIESVVVVVRRIEGGDPYEFGMALGRKYGVGSRKQNTGLIVVISTEDRRYHILTGRGLEGTLPDAICKRVENRVMVPYLRSDDWDAAVLESVKALCGYIDGDPELRADKRDDSDDGKALGAAIALAVVIAVFAFVYTRRGRGGMRRCPRCGKSTLHATHARMVRCPDGRTVRQVTWQCDHCHYIEIRDEDDNDRFNGGAFLPPILFLGGLRGSGFGHYGGGSGGFSGGSFGGGSFGGGGAGGNF